MPPIGIPGPVGDGSNDEATSSCNQQARDGASSESKSQCDEESDEAPEQEGGASRLDEPPRRSNSRHHQHDAHDHRSSQSPKYHKLTLEEVEAMIDRLPFMVATGAISPQQSSAMLAALKTREASLKREGNSSSSKRIDPRNWREKLKDDPSLLHMLAPYLSDDELADLLEGVDGA